MNKCIRYISFLLVLLLCIPAAAAEPAKSVLNDEQFTNILLIGRDSFEEQSARSDCMILCSFSPDTGSILFTSFLRDLYLPIPGYQDNRLNAAYAYGGMPLLRETVEKNFEIAIDGCIEVDFSSFPKIIDALGGVSLDLRQDEADAINREIPGTLSEGGNLLSGEQALAYSRIRKLDQDGDFSRTLRQRKLLTSLLERYREADLLTILSAAADMLPLISTTFSNRDILRLCIRLFPLLKDPRVTSLQIPKAGSYTCSTIRGMAVLTADIEELRLQLHTAMIPEPEGIPGPSGQ